MCGSYILLQPALVADLYGIVLIAVVVGNLGGAATEIDGIDGILQAVDQILQAVDLVLEAGDVRNNGARDVDGLVGALVGGEGAHGQAVLRDGERGVIHHRDGRLVLDVSRRRGVGLVPVALLLGGDILCGDVAGIVLEGAYVGRHRRDGGCAVQVTVVAREGHSGQAVVQVDIVVDLVLQVAQAADGISGIGR